METRDPYSISLEVLKRETVETVSDFIFLGSKITADGDFSHEIKSSCGGILEL